MKRKYYSLKKLTKKKCDIYIIIGGRNNGKSYSVKERCIKDYKETGGKIAYIRRFDIERSVKNVEKYFLDAKIDDDEVIECYTDNIYLSKKRDDNKKSYDEIIGYYFSIQNEPKYKSNNYPNVSNIIFDEFITDSSYLFEELKHFDNLLSTISRNENCTLWMIGNTLDRLCPYFDKYKIDIRNIKQGNIYYFDIQNDNGTISKLGIEYCSSEDVFTSNIISGTTINMISKGEWDIDETLNTANNWKSFTMYDIDNPLFEFYIQQSKVCYKGLVLELIPDVIEMGTWLNPPKLILYFYPYSFEKLHQKKDINKIRIIDLNTTLPENMLHSGTLLNTLIRCDNIVMELFNKNCVVCSDYLTAKEIDSIRKKKGWC